MEIPSNQDPLNENDFAPYINLEQHFSWVFVSHSANDYRAVQRLLLPFELERFLTFHIANRAMGAEFQEKYKPLILTNLARCAWVVVCVSNASVRSDWVRFEVDLAVRYKRADRIICLILDDTNVNLLPGLFGTRTIDVRSIVRGRTLISWFARLRLRHALPQGTLEQMRSFR
jgi:hypothetical protein